MTGPHEAQTPRLVGKARFRIILAMLDGKITLAEALRMQAMGPMELIMAVEGITRAAL
jgi:hypothetical protein